MARSLSAAARSAMFAQQTGEAPIVLLELSHPEFADVIRVCSNDLAIVSRGSTYVPFPFDIVLPDDADDAVPRVTLRIDNVDRRIVQELRGISGGSPVSVALFVVLASSPNVVEIGPLEFTLRDAEYSAATVEGTLLYEDVLNKPFPAESFTPPRFPALF